MPYQGSRTILILNNVSKKMRKSLHLSPALRFDAGAEREGDATYLFFNNVFKTIDMRTLSHIASYIPDDDKLEDDIIGSDWTTDANGTQALNGFNALLYPLELLEE